MTFYPTQSSCNNSLLQPFWSIHYFAHIYSQRDTNLAEPPFSLIQLIPSCSTIAHSKIYRNFYFNPDLKSHNSRNISYPSRIVPVWWCNNPVPCTTSDIRIFHLSSGPFELRPLPPTPFRFYPPRTSAELHTHREFMNYIAI